MKSKFLFVSFLLVSISVHAQTFGWVKSSGGASWDEGNSIAIDSSGNLYITGFYQGVADFDPGLGTARFSSQGFKDIFIQKLDPSGNLVWAQTFGGNGEDEAISIKVDISGNSYTIGTFQGTVDFDPGPGIFNLTSEGWDDIFIQKLDPSGSLIWAKSFGGGFDEFGSSIAIDAVGNIYSTGWFQGTVDFDPGPGLVNLTSNGSSDIFIQKLDTSGNLLWAKSFGSSNPDAGHSMVIDLSGNVFITGYFRGTVDFDPGPGVAQLTSNGKSDVFVQKLDASGNLIWAKSFGGADTDEVQSIAVDFSGNVFTIGHFRMIVDFDPGPGTYNLSSSAMDLFIQKLDSSGQFQWASSSGNSGRVLGESITVDISGNLYITGSFDGTADFDPGPGTVNIVSEGSNDVFIQKLDASGNFLWVNTFRGPYNDRGLSNVVDESGNLYTTGFYQDIVDFDPGWGTVYSLSVGYKDLFVQKTIQGSFSAEFTEEGILLSAFPNPFSNSIQIKTERVLRNVEISIVDLQGRVVFIKHYDSLSNERIKLDEPLGIYSLRIKMDNNLRVVKLIKE